MTDIQSTALESSKPKYPAFVLILWLFALAVIVFSVANRPGLGLSVSAQVERAGLQVTSVTPAGPASTALTPGQTLLAVASNGREMLLDKQLKQHPLLLAPAKRTQFFSEQQTLNDILQQPILNAQSIDGSWLAITNHPHRQGLQLSRMSLLAIVMTSIALMAAIYGWRLKHAQPSNRVMIAFYALGLVLITGALLYAERELSLTARHWQQHIAVLSLGIAASTFALITLLLRLPRPLCPAFISYGLAAICTFFVLNSFHGEWPNLQLAPHTLFSLGAVVILTIIALQGWRAHGRPLDTAAWQWLVLYLVLPIALTYFIGWVNNQTLPILIIIPAALSCWGLTKASVHWQLFRARKWSLAILLFLLSTLLIIATIMLLKHWLELSLLEAILLAALILTPLAYIGGLWLRRRLHPSRKQIESQVIDWIKKSTHQPQSSEDNWQALLQHHFSPKLMQPAQHTKPCLMRSGMSLSIPALSAEKSYQLSGHEQGKQLFSCSDLALANKLLSVTRQLEHNGLFPDNAPAPRHQQPAQDDVLRVNPQDSFFADDFDIPTDESLEVTNTGEIPVVAVSNANLNDNLITDCRQELQRFCSEHSIALTWPKPDQATRQLYFSKAHVDNIISLTQDLLFTLPILLKPNSLQVECNHKASRFYLSMRLSRIAEDRMYATDVIDLQRDLKQRAAAISGSLIFDERAALSQQKRLAIVLVLPLD